MHRVALSDRTNQPDEEVFKGVKRRATNETHDGLEKRVKLRDASCNTFISNESPENEDIQMEVDETCSASLKRKRQDVHNSLRALRLGSPASRRSFNLPTTRVLETFVSSHKADLYKCHSLAAASFLTPPYACAFSNGSKGGKSSKLAVATEGGTVDVIDVMKRMDWDSEPPRSTLEIHANGIFDIKWSPDDRLIATASGDNTVRITDPTAWKGESLHVLAAHSATPKCVVWDPNHNSMLASAGRDGCICLWDLRESRRPTTTAGDEDDAINPTVRIPWAHETNPGKPSRKGRVSLAAKSVTSLVYSPASPYEVISSGSADGILRKWDLRCVPTTPSKRTRKAQIILPIDEAVEDLTKLANGLSAATLVSSPQRSRGISSLAWGSGPSVGKLFALANDSRVHTYNPLGAAGTPLDILQPGEQPFSHRHMSTSFYVKIGVSPCGRWLASGGSSGSAFVFDVGSGDRKGIELRGQEGEVGALDWADGALATCADDGTVRIWRPDLRQHRLCQDNPTEEQYVWSWAKA